MNRQMQECRACNASVFWARTLHSHTPIHVDWEPVENGNILIDVQDKGRRLVAVVLPPGDERIEAETTYTAHVETCPESSHWRRR